MGVLEQAARLVEQAQEPLNDNFAFCDCCGFKQYEDFNEHQACVELRAMAEKLRRWERKLARP
jgi:hypothetical protein